MFVPDSILAVWVYFEEEGAFVEVEQLGEEAKSVVIDGTHPNVLFAPFERS